MIDIQCVRRGLRCFDKSDKRFVFALILSLLGHTIFFIYVYTSVFSPPQNAPSKTISPKFLSVQLAEKTHLVVLEAKQDATVEKGDIPVKPQALIEPEAVPDEQNNTRSDDDISGSKLNAILSVKYYSLSELDQIPVTRNEVDMSSLDLLDYPQPAKLALRLWVDEYGKVAQVEAINTELPADFVERASQLFMQARFFPGTVNSRPVRFVSTVVIRYVPLHSRPQ